MILKSDRLYLRQLEKDDLANLIELYGDPEVMRYIMDGRPLTDEAQIKYELSNRIKYYDKFPGYGVWPARRRADHEFVGWFALKYLDQTDEVEVGYRLLRKYWGFGFATEMTRELIDYGFNEMGLKKIVGVAHPENKPSLKVLEKSGLEYRKRANFYGCEVVYYSIDNWLNNFSYRIAISPIIFLFGSALVWLFVIITISFNVIQVIKIDPVKGLHYD